MDGHHKTKLMMVPVMVWISTDIVNVAKMRHLLLAHMDLDVLTILLVNNYLIHIKDFRVNILFDQSLQKK